MKEGFEDATRELLQSTGDHIADALEQIQKCDFRDVEGHSALDNNPIAKLYDALLALGKFRSDWLGYAPLDFKDVEK